MKHYPHTKATHIDWLGEIPSHWEVRKIKNIGNIVNGATPSSSNPKFWDGEITWVTPKDINNQQYIEHSERNITNQGYMSCGTQLVPANSIVLTTRAPIGKLAIAKKMLCTNQGCKSIAIYKNIEPRYVYYFLSVSSEVLNALGTGTTFMELASVNLANFKIPLPPLAEQAAIADYLDAKVAQIQTAIRQKQAQIDRLKEYRQALINQTVTKGLNPTACRKDSGVPWLGEVPSHWEVKKLKFVAQMNTQTLPENTPKNTLVQYVDIGSVSFENGIEKVEQFTFGNAPSRARRLAKTGDTIVSTVRTYLKAITVIKDEFKDCVFSTGFAVLSPNSEMNSAFLAYFTKSDAFTVQVTLNSKGMSYPAINSTELSNLLLAIPPLAEQTAIAEFLDSKTAQIDRTLAAFAAQIDKLGEYQRRLVNDVVTGKIDVRQA